MGGGGNDGSDESLLRGDTTVRTALAGISFAHELAAFETVRTELRLNVDYVRGVTDAYEESGDPFLALGFDERVRESLGLRAGIELTRAVGTARGVFLPQLGVDWIHESRDDAQRVVGTLQRGPVLRQCHPRRRTRSGLRLGQPGTDVPRERRAADLRGLRAGCSPTTTGASHTVSLGARLELP